jgi:hypothetical protein
MLCEAANVVRGDLGLPMGLGCNISVTLSDGGEIPYFNQGEVSPKKLSFFDNLLRRSPSSEKKNKPKSSLFSKKAPATLEPHQEDEEMAKFIQELQFEGKSDEEISVHLAHIIEARSPPPAQQPPSPKSSNILTQFFKDVRQVFKEGFGDAEVYYVDDGFDQASAHALTVRISSGPFFAALPPDSDMSYEELASLEPVYVGSRCINNLPTCKHDGTPLPGDQSNCSICLGEFTKGESLKSLLCVHFFHKDCIDAWLMVGHTCPVCKLLVE